MFNTESFPIPTMSVESVSQAELYPVSFSASQFNLNFFMLDIAV